MKYIFIYLFSTLLTLQSYNQNFQRIVKLPANLNEVSGLVYASQNEFWWHNDGGNKPVLYKTNNKGEIIDSIYLGAIKNIDWEEITKDTLGNIYIGDFGNNNNNRNDLKIYIYNVYSYSLDSILFHYSDQHYYPARAHNGNYDMEAMFFYRDSLHLFSKNKIDVGSGYTKHYTLPCTPGKQVAIVLDSLFLGKYVVTGAAINHEHSKIILLAYYYKFRKFFLPSSQTCIFHIQKFEGNNFLKGKVYKQKIPRFIVSTQYEAIDFINESFVYIASEKTHFIKPKARKVKLKNKHEFSRK